MGDSGMRWKKVGDDQRQRERRAGNFEMNDVNAKNESHFVKRANNMKCVGTTVDKNMIPV